MRACDAEAVDSVERKTLIEKCDPRSLKDYFTILKKDLVLTPADVRFLRVAQEMRSRELS